MRRITAFLAVVAASLAMASPAAAQAIDCTSTHWNAKATSLFKAGYKCDDSYGWDHPGGTWSIIAFRMIDWSHNCPGSSVWFDEWWISFKHPATWEVAHTSHCSGSRR